MPLLKYVLAACAALFFLSQIGRLRSPTGMTWAKEAQEAGSPSVTDFAPAFRAAGNRTMGFEKILVINLEQRSDRRDRMSLLSAHTGIDIEYVPGMKGEQVDPKSIPLHWDPASGMGNLGSYRSHIGAVREIVEKGYRSAIIMEDDLDWDLNVKYQLPLFASNLDKLPPSTFTPLSQAAAKSTPNAPYGLNWDVIWLGTCMRPDPPANAHTYKDPVLESEIRVWNTDGGIACTHAYGLTYESAKAILAYGLDLNQPWDLHMSNFCKAHVCPLPSPPIIGFHQAAGRMSGASDISPQGSTGEVREHAISIGVKHSALLDITENVLPKPDFPPLAGS